MTPWTVARQAPLSLGILQARELEWVAIPFPEDLPQSDFSFPPDLSKQALSSPGFLLFFVIVCCKKERYFKEEQACKKSVKVTSSILGFPFGSDGKESACQSKRPGFGPWVRKVPQRGKWQPTSVFLPGESHGQRSLAGYSPWGHKGSDTTE